MKKNQQKSNDGREYVYLTEADKIARQEEIAQNKRERDQAYREANKDKIAESRRQYYRDNKEKILEHKKQYYQVHKEELSEYNKEYYQDHKEELSEYKKQYYQDHKEHYRQYYQEHKEEKSEYYKKYYQEHKKELLAKSQQDRQTKRELAQFKEEIDEGFFGKNNKKPGEKYDSVSVALSFINKNKPKIKFSQPVADVFDQNNQTINNYQADDQVSEGFAQLKKDIEEDFFGKNHNNDEVIAKAADDSPVNYLSNSHSFNLLFFDQNNQTINHQTDDQVSSKKRKFVIMESTPVEIINKL